MLTDNIHLYALICKFVHQAGTGYKLGGEGWVIWTNQSIWTVIWTITGFVNNSYIGGRMLGKMNTLGKVWMSLYIIVLYLYKRIKIINEKLIY